MALVSFQGCARGSLLHKSHAAWEAGTRAPAIRPELHPKRHFLRTRNSVTNQEPTEKACFSIRACSNKPASPFFTPGPVAVPGPRTRLFPSRIAPGLEACTRVLQQHYPPVSVPRLYPPSPIRGGQPWAPLFCRISWRSHCRQPRRSSSAPSSARLSSRPTTFISPRRSPSSSPFSPSPGSIPASPPTPLRSSAASWEPPASPISSSSAQPSWRRNRVRFRARRHPLLVRLKILVGRSHRHPRRRTHRRGNAAQSAQQPLARLAPHLPPR